MFKKNQNLDQVKKMEEIENKFKSSNPSRERSKEVKKKNFTFYVSIETMEELDDFLEEFGFGETKGDFIEKAIKHAIVLRKQEIRAQLEEKLEKLKH